MDLVHEFTFRASLKPPLAIGAGPIGARMYYELSGGEVVGDRLELNRQLPLARARQPHPDRCR